MVVMEEGLASMNISRNLQPENTEKVSEFLQGYN